jgi:predicted membrane metal-binding protein
VIQFSKFYLFFQFSACLYSPFLSPFITPTFYLFSNSTTVLNCLPGLCLPLAAPAPRHEVGRPLAAIEEPVDHRCAIAAESGALHDGHVSVRLRVRFAGHAALCG